jgi:hypothetical protein
MRAFVAANSAFLSQLQHLQLLDADPNEAIELLLAAIVMQCPRLQRLDLEYLALASAQPPELQPLAGLTQLTRLQLGLKFQLRYSDLTSAISGITGLRELSVWDFDTKRVSSELRGTTALQRLSRLEFFAANFYPQQDFGCLAAMPSLRSLRFDDCDFHDEPSSLSRLTMLEELALVACTADTTDEPFQLPLSALAALTSLRSLDPGGRDISQDLDQQALQQLRPVLAGLGRLRLGRICGVGDPQLLSCIGCTQLEFRGFEDCAEPAAGAAPPLPSVSSLRLTSCAPLLEPLVLLQVGLTSLGLLHSTDASCEQLSRAFPQLRVLQLGWACPSSEPSAAGLAHLGALQQLQQLHLAHLRLEPSQLQQLSAISSLRRLLIQVGEESSRDEAHLSQQPASALEAALAGLVGAASSRLREVLLLVVEGLVSQGRREALQAACDRVVAASGRQDLVAEVERWDEDEAWERMLGQAAA